MDRVKINTLAPSSSFKGGQERSQSETSEFPLFFNLCVQFEDDDGHFPETGGEFSEAVDWRLNTLL